MSLQNDIFPSLEIRAVTPSFHSNLGHYILPKTYMHYGYKSIILKHRFKTDPMIFGLSKKFISIW
jgi:hypothetical protein